MEKNWTCIDVSYSGNLVEDVASEIAEEFAVGVEMRPQGFRFYLMGEVLNASDEGRLTDLLERFKSIDIPNASFAFSTSILEGDDWADRWKEFFKPLRVGNRFVICPTWEEFQLGPNDLLIAMDPGRAFGTGQHETTRMCLEWLEELAADYAGEGLGPILDVGTGTGILSIGAALLGFNPILGIDNDPEAIEVAAENLALNRLNDQVNLLTGVALDVDGRFDVIVSNIQAGPLVEMAQDLTRLLNPSGRIVLSGILLEQKERVAGAFEAQGLRLRGMKTAGEWCSLLFD